MGSLELNVPGDTFYTTMITFLMTTDIVLQCLLSVLCVSVSLLFSFLLVRYFSTIPTNERNLLTYLDALLIFAIAHSVVCQNLSFILYLVSPISEAWGWPLYYYTTFANVYMDGVFIALNVTRIYLILKPANFLNMDHRREFNGCAFMIGIQSFLCVVVAAKNFEHNHPGFFPFLMSVWIGSDFGIRNHFTLWFTGGISFILVIISTIVAYFKSPTQLPIRVDPTITNFIPFQVLNIVYLITLAFRGFLTAVDYTMGVGETCMILIFFYTMKEAHSYTTRELPVLFVNIILRRCRVNGIQPEPQNV